jgi:hypothetical protein
LGGGGTTAVGGDADAGLPVECPTVFPNGLPPAIDGEKCANDGARCPLGCESDCFCTGVGDAARWRCFSLGCK